MKVGETTHARCDVVQQTRRVGAPSPRRRRRWLQAWLLLAPLLMVNLLVILGPSVATVYYSLHEWTGLGPARFIGLGNFAALLTDREFHTTLWHNVLWLMIGLTVPVTLGLLGAFLLTRVRKFQFVFRVIFFTPVVIATVVVGAMWKNILDPSQGIGPTLAKMGIPFLENVAFLGDTRLALSTVAFISNWAFWGFLVAIFLSAMESIDPELLDAARVDGAGVWREFLHVVLPGILPTLIFVILISTVWSFTVFDFVWVITGGGPAGSTEVVGTLLYKNAFRRFEAGYAAAMGLSLTLISALPVIAYVLVRRRGWEV
jgi:raffinose/stachyose/melibiose transport system permease protein